nr:hypothetical protein [Tanacetum cinerariifolium]
MQTKTELTLEQTQQDSQHEPSDAMHNPSNPIKVSQKFSWRLNTFMSTLSLRSDTKVSPMMMEILSEPTSNKLCDSLLVGPKHQLTRSLRRKNPTSSKPKTSKIIRESSLITQVADTQHVEEPVATADATKSVDAYVHETIVEEAVKDFEITSLEMKEVDSELKSMCDDEIMSMSKNEKDINDTEELSKDDESDTDHLIDELVNMANTEDATLNEKKNIPRVKIPIVQTLRKMRRFKEIHITKASGSDPLSHLPRILDFLLANIHNVAKNMPSDLTQQLNTTTCGIPKIVSDAIVVQLLDLSTTLKDILPQML